MWEHTQMDPELEWRMWRQLKGAYAIDRFIFTPRIPKMEGYTFHQADNMEEALALAHGKVVFLEPQGINDMIDLAGLEGEDVTFVLGNTDTSNMELANPKNTYRIDTPKPCDMYPTNAAAAALSHWYYSR